MKKQLTSPITGSKNVTKILSIPTSDVIEAYRKDGFEDAKKYLEATDRIDIYKCLDTGYRYYYPFTIFGDDKFYEYLQKQKPSYSHLRWEHGPVLDMLTDKMKVLEIGSGSGEFIEKASETTKKVKGLEFNKLAIRSSRQRGLDVSGETIEEHADNNTSKYDLVCMFQVLEHISDVKPFLSASIKSLKKGGKLVVGVPNNNPYLFRYDMLHTLNLPPHHSGLWNKQSLRSLANYYGLEVESIVTEPLQELDLYWQIQRQHWQKNKPVLYALSSLINSNKLAGPRKYFLRRFCQGRNVLAIYKKK